MIKVGSRVRVLEEEEEADDNENGCKDMYGREGRVILVIEEGVYAVRFDTPVQLIDVHGESFEVKVWMAGEDELQEVADPR